MLVDRANNALAGYPAMASGATGQGATIGANGVSTVNAGVGGVNATYGQMTGAMQAAGGMAGGMESQGQHIGADCKPRRLGGLLFGNGCARYG